jgi:hypothetical protein|tara:strand:+ start:109 stop:354 length:246 start_codon:yes stop_codon:yes gene_type:complete
VKDQVSEKRQPESPAKENRKEKSGAQPCGTCCRRHRAVQPIGTNIVEYQYVTLERSNPLDWLEFQYSILQISGESIEEATN